MCFLLTDGQDAAVTEHRSAKEEQQIQSDAAEQHAQRHPRERLSLGDARDDVHDAERRRPEDGAQKQQVP